MAASVEERIGAAVALDAMSDVASSIELPLVIGVTTRTMFDLAEEHAVFVQEGVGAYAKLQRARENDPLKPGAAFEVTRRLLALNPAGSIPIVEVIKIGNPPALPG